jgi:hypothetical protein
MNTPINGYSGHPYLIHTIYRKIGGGSAQKFHYLAEMMYTWLEVSSEDVWYAITVEQ